MKMKVESNKGAYKVSIEGQQNISCISCMARCITPAPRVQPLHHQTVQLAPPSVILWLHGPMVEPRRPYLLR
jgi:hypothetical protein